MIPETANRKDWPRLVANAVNELIRTQEVTFNPLNHALKQIKNDYGVAAEYKPKTLAKFGRFATLGTSYEVVQEHGGVETHLTSNLIDVVVSDSASDTGAISIEGHTIDGSGNLTFVVQTATLNGVTNVTLSTPLARATRISNAGAVGFVGVVTVKDDSTATTYVTAGPDFNQSEKAATSVSQNDYWVITDVFGGVLEKTTASVDFSLQIKLQGGVYREAYGWSAASGSASVPHNLNVPIIAPANSDVRVMGKASASNVEVVARVSGFLALDKNT